MSRLPNSGEAPWDGILNDFLLASHNSDGTLKSSATQGRPQILTNALGFLSETHSPHVIGGGVQILTTQLAQFMLLGFRAGDVVSSLTWYVSTAGASLTLVKVGLYKTDGTQLAVSADDKANWTSTGIKKVLFISPYTIPTEGGYYAAILAVGTTPPTISRGTSLPGTLVAVGAFPRPAAQQASLSDLSGTATFADTGVSYWVRAA